MKESELPDIEIVSRIVHDSWWAEKKKEGFHAPMDCPSENHLAYKEKVQHQKVNIDEKTFKWCDKCHPDMYPYEELPENIKELDRVTVRSVYRAIVQLTEKS